MDMATLMSMMSQNGQGAGQPMVQSGDPQAGGLGFGLGQQMMQGQQQQGQFVPGQTQFAQGTGAQPGIMDQLQAMFSQNGQGATPGQSGGLDPAVMAKLMPLAQQMMQQHQMGQAPMMGGMHSGGGGMQNNTQASRGYLAQGGGIAPRQIINQSY